MIIIAGMEIQPTFHNVAEAETLPGLPGLYLQRYPRKIREQLNNSARQKGEEATGVEIRFKTTAPQVRVALTADVGEEGEMIFYRGAFEHSRYKLPQGQTTTISLPYVGDLFSGQPVELLRGGDFSPDVWRLCLHRCAVRFHGLNTFGHPLLPLMPEDTPRLRWLAYGSSITHSWLDGYVFMAAKLLGVDVANKGLGGGCHAESEAAEFFVSQDWDFLTAELGINMMGSYSAEMFESQVKRFLRILREGQPNKPIVIISPYRNGVETYTLPNHIPRERLLAYREILAEIHASANDPLLSFIDGNDILDRLDFLRFDLVHPSTHGHARMGMNLSQRLRPLVDLLGRKSTPSS